MKKTTRTLAPYLLACSCSLALLQGSALLYAADAEPEEEEYSIVFPEALQTRFTELSEAELAFLYTDDAVGFVEDEAALFEALEKRSPEEIKAFVAAMMWVKEQQGFVEGRDADSIPLNTEDPAFNAWLTRRPASFDPAREPGPIDLSRYQGGGSGIPTFAGAPVALTPEDLIAGEVDIAIVGAPLNMGSGWRDADYGPLALRTARGFGGNDQYVQVNSADVLNIVDYGDIAIDNDSTERSMQEVRRVVREIAEAGAMPFIVGGDHSLEYPNVAGLVDVHGKGNLAVIHFDAHYDVGRENAHYITHGMPIYRLLREELIEGSDYIQVGLRANSPNEATYKWLQEEGFKYHSMAEVEKFGWDYVLERIIAEATAGGRKLHISFDVDVLDPSFISATGTPVSGGLTPREAIPIIRRLCAEANVVGFDIVEVAPALDPTYVSAMHSAHIAKACLTGVAMRRLGLTEAHYLNPISTDHAQDDYQQQNPR